MKNRILNIGLVVMLSLMVTTSCKKAFLDETLDTLEIWNFIQQMMELNN